MKYIVELPPDVYERAAVVSKARGLPSVSQFIQTAIVNQLALEEAEEGLVSTEPMVAAVNPPTTSTLHRASSSHAGAKKATQKLPASPDAGPWAGLAQADIEWGAIATATHLHLDPAPIWGQCNRIFPLKVALRELASMSARRADAVPLDEFVGSATNRAIRARESLESLDEKHEIPRGERLSAAFPKDTAESRLRFHTHFLARVQRDNTLGGTLAAVGLVGHNDESTKALLLSDAGLAFARIENPILDSGDGINSLSSTEADFFISHLKARVRGEWMLVYRVLSWISEGATTPEDLRVKVQQGWRDWTPKVVDTMRAGVLGRMQELGLIEREREGLYVTYRLSSKGRHLLKDDTEVTANAAEE